MIGKVTQGHELTAAVEETCDVCIVGSGAGGAVLAAGLVEQGLNVVMLEAGGYHTRRDFDLNEGKAYPMFYQDRGGRSTKDQAITVLQGRTVGGSTTINWTTCFRTPKRILDHWAKAHGIEGLDEAALAPHFAAVEQRLNIATWPEELANANNRALLDGARALGWEAAPLRRNVRGCANSGYCGVGCPVDGKQAMHVTYLPDAVAGGLRLYSDVHVDTVEFDQGRATGVQATVMKRGTQHRTAVPVHVKAKVVALCGGAINTPALLLRSGLNGNGRVGHRTFLHPVIAVTGEYAHRIDGFFGAPQSIGSHQHIDQGPDQWGFFLETAPMQPMLGSGNPAMGRPLHDMMERLPHLSAILALHVDGWVPHDDGGTVTIDGDGRPVLEYPIRQGLAEAFQKSHRLVAQVHFAAGASRVSTLHRDLLTMSSPAELDRLDTLPYGAHEHAIFSAHQMGGCAMGPDPATSVVDVNHRHHEVPNLYVVDGSVLPTALGVNPSQTIYGLAHRARTHVGSAV
ncbi:MAG: GMC family oxidoreductase [Myxococcota bacterium]